MSLGTDIHEIL